ncbi:DsbA family protein [Phenylobacterium hankyongense]|uniref:DsbA family protein n=1 Tax=Phenylobacterium hankyongense TaxID=1813876 RepID=A0A328B2U7_9CAUL|nr:DsbA family protein [Phenylobacterium hankyongense]RAK61762.1 DsbA family protein [Phenylobacterium hankyongense]
MGSFSRRAALAAAALLIAGAAVAAPVAGPQDMSLGNPKAKIQVLEYASLSCPHCAKFNEDVFPAFKKKYVDTGKVRYTLKEMLTDPPEVAAAGFMMARCAGPSKYFKVVDEVFRSQPRWQTTPIKPVFLEIAKANGLTDAQFEACLADEAALKAVRGRAQDAQDHDGVDGTPTFFVNGKKVGAGDMSLAELEAAIAAAGK